MRWGTLYRRNRLQVQHVAVPGFSQYEMELVYVDVVIM